MSLCGMLNQKHLLVKADLDFAKLGVRDTWRKYNGHERCANELQLQAKPEPVHHIVKPVRTAAR